ncbi:hypothetical protein GCM10028814_12930 [Angustibacter aerolatus]
MPAPWQAERFRTTRWHATVTTFGPRTKLALTVPTFVPALLFAGILTGPPDPFWAIGVLGVAGCGSAAAWWARQVWQPGSVARGAAPPSEPRPEPDLEAEATRRPAHGSLGGDVAPPTRW